MKCLHRTTKIQWTLVITNSLGPVKSLYIQICVISPLQKQESTQKFISFGPRKLLRYIRILLYWSVFFITGVHCTNIWYNVYEFRKGSHCKATTICKTLTSCCLCLIYHILHGCCQQTKMYIHLVDIPDFMHDFKL